MLPRASCVGNDVGLNPESRFYVVSGSNMPGKSTLLRAIGLNADPMDFDYRLKPGVTNEANAVAIARMAGVPI